MFKSLTFIMLAGFTGSVYAQSDSTGHKQPTAMTWKEVASYKSIATYSANLSPDGKWFAYPVLPIEGDGELLVKKCHDTIERRYPIGSVSFASYSFSEDGNWIAYKESPSFKETKAATKTPGKQLFDKLILVELATGKKTVFEKAGNFAFNGKASSWLAVTLQQEKSPSAKPDDPKSSDLLLVQLGTGKILTIGHVGEFAFNKPGALLAYTVEVPGKNGNGVCLFSIANRQTTILDNDKMTYKSLAWKEEGEGFALLKTSKDDKYKTERGIVIGVKDPAHEPVVSIYDPAKDSLHFPKGMTASATRQPQWSDDMTRIFFGIHELKPEKKEGAKPEVAKDSSSKKDSAKTGPTKTETAKDDAGPHPDMTIWNWQDRRLQSRQQVQEGEDKDFAYWCMYDVAAARYTRLQDSGMHSLTILPKSLYGVAFDNGAYELEENLDGQSYYDFYIVDLHTGQHSKWMEKAYMPGGSAYPKASPDGKKLVYGQDGQFYVYSIPDHTTTDLTTKSGTSFIDSDDDHPVKKPLTPVIGWSADSRFVLIADLWDIWQLPASGKGPSVNLTVNGRSDRIRHPNRYILDRDEKGIDLSKPVYVSLYGEWTKRSGIGRIMPGQQGLKPGVESLVWQDSSIRNLSRARNAPVYVFTRESFSRAPEFFVADAGLKEQSQLTHNTPDAGKYLWSAGTQLVNYVSDKGDSLQGALFLPAGYQKGKKYPTIVYYYEKLSQTLHDFASPSYSRTGWNPAMYTSNGYAVFIPDIVYKIDDPGMSAVWCVIPGVKAAIQTGVIDENNIGIHGHSWGGYQTAFLITQTHMFKAAAAGAPLTDLVSMYDLIYWNSGGGNMAIFEASQGRFTGGPWENWDAYHRNSPIYHVKNVQTPLLMLHNDKDGAVDFTQGIEYFNALRRLKKPVVMITYKGENHGLAKMENRKDYCVRMMEFFDTYLKSKPAPDWMSKGIDRLDMDDHLEGRTMGVNN